MSGVSWVKEKLASSFKLIDLGELRYYLKVSFEQKMHWMLFHQSEEFTFVLQRFGIDFPMPHRCYWFINGHLLQSSGVK